MLRPGGICHYVNPRRGRTDPSEHLDGRYADEAVRMFIDAVNRHGTRPAEYEVGLFGGGYVGGTGPRVVELDLTTGTIRLRHSDLGGCVRTTMDAVAAGAVGIVPKRGER